jgi:5-formyltetrahydrofolate cyclo-ligase
MTSAADRERVRRDMRTRRRALSDEERQRAARQLARVASRCRLLSPGRRIAVYLPYGGEADPSALVAVARRRGCLLYLPVITDYRSHRMSFHLYDQQGALRENRYGILEPAARDALPTVRLDLVFAPLVAFDDRGFRLGSGAGFYDRALHRLRAGRRWRRPRLIGLGYEFQRVTTLDSAQWDVPLDGVLTEKNFYRTLRP